MLLFKIRLPLNFPDSTAIQTKTFEKRKYLYSLSFDDKKLKLEFLLKFPKLINFTLGADVLVGFTQGRRDYLYDVMRPDNAKRLGVLIGVRTGWFIPMFKRNSEDMMFE
jgi:hypothetical protein